MWDERSFDTRSYDQRSWWLGVLRRLKDYTNQVAVFVYNSPKYPKTAFNSVFIQEK